MTFLQKLIADARKFLGTSQGSAAANTWNATVTAAESAIAAETEGLIDPFILMAPGGLGAGAVGLVNGFIGVGVNDLGHLVMIPVQVATPAPTPAPVAAPAAAPKPLA